MENKDKNDIKFEEESVQSSLQDDSIATDAAAATLNPKSENQGPPIDAAEENNVETTLYGDLADSNTEEVVAADPYAATPSDETTDMSQDKEIIAEEISFFEDSYGAVVSPTPEFGAEVESTVPEAENEAQISFFDDSKPKPKPKISEIPAFIPKAPRACRVKRARAYDPEHPRGIDTFFDIAELLILSIALVLFLTSFFFRHSIVRGDSMMNTLHDGEHLFISDFMYEPKRGDIVVIMDLASTGFDFAIVKRVIAIGGDHIQVTSGGVVTLNGKRLTEDYVYLSGTVYSKPIDIIVPEGEIFVMGDHRNNSTDSRAFTTIKEEAVIGRVIIRIYPFDKFGKVTTDD